MKTRIHSIQSAKVLSPRGAAGLIFAALLLMAVGNIAGAQLSCPAVFAGATQVNAINVVPPDDPNGTVTNPTSAALSPDGKNFWVGGYYASNLSGWVSVINVKDQTLTTTLPVAGRPYDFAFSPPGGRVFVAGGSSVTEFEGHSLAFVQTKDVIVHPYYFSPWGVVADADHILVTNAAAEDEASAVELDSSPTLGRHEKIYIPNGETEGFPALVPATATYDAGMMLMPGEVLTPQFYSPFGYPDLAVIDPATGEIIKSLILDSFGSAVAEQVVVSPEGKYAYVALSLTPTLTTQDQPSAIWVVSLKDLTTKTLIPTCDPFERTEALSADGKYLLVVGAYGEVALINTATETLEAILPGNLLPVSVALTSDGSKAFLVSGLGTVDVFSFDPPL